ncbi:alpha/beta hydrolase [Stenotrophomonas sp. PFBMAA-4]|uniref:alpha/beta hydrolase n=1 Tax=Stenotrophomonas sp. PFBMAA-4 TaxID=3043301 RepID=UPI0024B48AF7|nr:alpha/beta hydrolase [Stenotrophomonas sp. PFBMAA-4]MDI9275274.1 alpha/beta hydrolase [Stenotrophomonas sp. PFBMAA-4]
MLSFVLEALIHLRDAGAALLVSLRDLPDATNSDAADANKPDLQKAANEALASWQALRELSEHRGVHYRTRAKLAELIDISRNVAQGWEIIASTSLPGGYQNPQVLLAIARMTDYLLLDLLPPAIRYYERSAEVAHSERGTISRRSKPTPATEPIFKQASRLAYQYEAVPPHLLPRAGSHVSPSDSVIRGPVEVPVYYGTTRTRCKAADISPRNHYRNGRGNGQLSLGIARVSIPRGHTVGKMERPLTIWKLRLKENSSRHIVVQSVTEMACSEWITACKGELKVTDTKSAFLFIHGFNVEFAEAVSRAAQIARDIDYKGLVCAFSWASLASVKGYAADEDTVQLDSPQLREFLRTLHQDVGVEELHIVAHSMGNRALLPALKDHGWWRTNSTPVAQAVFAAPDVDAMIYRQAMAAMPKAAGRYTLYGSERDWAIALSRGIRNSHPRAGDGGKNILVLPGVETIDASTVGDGLFGLGHSYIADKTSILADLRQVLNGVKMTRTGLEQTPHADGMYWRIPA